MSLSDLDPAAVAQALDDHDPDREHFLDRETGSLWTFVFSAATDETRARHDGIRADPDGRWIPVPSMTPQEAYEEAEDFADSLPEGDVQEALWRALERRGALRNFREELMRHPEERQQWLSFRRERTRGRLERFLGALGVEPREGSGVGG